MEIGKDEDYNNKNDDDDYINDENEEDDDDDEPNINDFLWRWKRILPIA